MHVILCARDIYRSDEISHVYGYMYKCMPVLATIIFVVMFVLVTVNFVVVVAITS